MTQENRYANGKIYRLVNSVDGEEYVGSTCDTLPKRCYRHKNTAKRRPTRRVYEHLNEVGWDNVSIVLVQEYDCENKMQLERREREVIEELKPTLNKYIPTRTQSERYKGENAERYREIKAKYREANRDVINERKRQSRKDNNQDEANVRRREHRQKNHDAINASRCEHRQNNHDAIREKEIQYYEANRDSINAKKRERYARKKAEREAS